MANKVNTEAVDESVENDDYRPAQDVSTAIASLNNSDAAFYTSLKQDDFAGKQAVAKALTSSNPINEHIGETINLRHVIVQAVQVANEQTGEVNEAPRVTLIDDDGNAFHGTSIGLLSAVRNITGVLGEPDAWPSAVPVNVVEKRGRRGFRFFTIELA